MKKEILYLSNLITLSRFLLLSFTVYFLISDNLMLSLIFITLIWLSDILDGYTARLRNEISELGKILDPVADKLCVAVIMLILVTKNMVPVWFCFIVILRDVLILSGAYYIKKKKNIVLQSDIIGKVAVFTIGFTFYCIVLKFSAVKGDFGDRFKEIFAEVELLIYILLFLSIVMIIVSLISYFRKLLINLNKNTR